MEKLLQSFTAILVIGFLVGCGGRGSGEGSGWGSGEGSGLSIQEYDYFPKLDIPAVSIEHSIQRRFDNADDATNFINNFKSKGSYYTDYVGSNVIIRNDPLNDSLITRATVSTYPIALNTVYTDILIEKTNPLMVNIDTISRNNELFKMIFGHTDAPITYVQVEKKYTGLNTSKLEIYGAKLVNSGYTRSGDLWIKYDLENQHIMWMWGYTTGSVPNMDGVYDFILATWTIEKTL
jgi:hypothetical protein